ncbi:hypothetical protein [Corynebacterium gerontici]|nr:hypothetical protein [Corynebacterium gerontici]
MQATQELLHYLHFSGYSPNRSTMSQSLSAQALQQLEARIHQNLHREEQHIHASHKSIGTFITKVFSIDEQLEASLR